MTESVPTPTPFPVDGRRLVIYTFYDRRGEVEEYVLQALAGLRPHAARLIVVVNGDLGQAARSMLHAACDLLIQRENSGLDVGAQRAVLETLGSAVEEYDEILLTNDTWYGPIPSFGRVFERMNAQSAHFWGMTAHTAASPHPLTRTGSVPYHVQSHWIAIRRGMTASAAWGRYWEHLPPIRDYRDAVLLHESRFTEHFHALGFTSAAAFDADRYPSENASLWMPEQLLDDGCPILKRRVLFHPPLALDRHAVVGSWVIRSMLRAGFPESVLWTDLARNVQPKVLSTNAGLLEILPTDDTSYDPSQRLRIAVVAHVFYEDMTDAIMDRADALPGGYDLFITTPTRDKADLIEGIARRRRPVDRRTEIRVVASNDGRDQSAFLIGARDVLLDDYDLIVKLHSKRTPQDGHNIGRHFGSQQFDNLLASRGYAANVVGLFQRQPHLGIVYPPAIHIGYPTLGQAWWANKPAFVRLCRMLGIHVPLDESSPLAPFGSMYIARPDALRLMVEHDWRYSDFGGADQYRDGGLAHVLERMPSYAAAERGYITRTILTPEYAAISHPALEFDLDQLTALVPATAEEQLDALARAGHFGYGRARDFVRVFVRVRAPGAGARLRRWLRPVRQLRNRLRGDARPVEWDAGTVGDQRPQRG